MRKTPKSKAPWRWNAALLLGLSLALPTQAAAERGDRYYCRDVSGDLATPSEFYLDWPNDRAITMQFIENTQNSGPTTTDRIVYVDRHAFVAINTSLEAGISTISLMDTPGGASTIRTFIDGDYSFVEKSDCVIQR
jgi:hypothetical protein